MRTRNKLFILLASISVVPMLIIVILYYGIFNNVSQQKLITASQNTLEQIDKVFSLKFQRVKKNVDLIFGNVRIQQLFRDINFNDDIGETKSVEKELDNIFLQNFYGEKDIQGIVIFFCDGGTYTYNCDVMIDNYIDFVIRNGKINKAPGEITWFGTKSDLTGKETFLAGTILTDINYKKDAKYLASVYFIMKEDFISDALVSKDPRVTTMVYERSGKKMFSSKKESFDTLWEYPIKFGYNISSQEKGAFREQVMGKNEMVLFYNSSFTDWIIIQLMPYDFYVNEINYIKYITYIIFGIVLIAIAIASWVISRTASLPVKQLVSGMEGVANEQYDIRMPIRKSNDEIKMIFIGFNNMVEQIQNLFKKIVQEEQKKKDAEIRALQYQINPHFLYNTLTALRVRTILKGDNELAQVILTLSRLLKNSIRYANSLITIEEDINNIKDYIDILQLRYNNQLNVSYDVDPELLSFKTLGMLLQPIVENSVYHGLNKKLAQENPNDLAQLKICVRLKETSIVMEVWDNGIGLTETEITEIFSKDDDERPGDRIGIKNIYERIVLRFGKPYGITIKSVKGDYTCVSVELPIIKTD